MNVNGKTLQVCYEDHIAALLKQLGIPADYGIVRQLELQEECVSAVSIGMDIFDREQQLIPLAARAWLEMKAAAEHDGIELQIVSAFRAVDYQAGIIRRKLEAGLCMDEILKASAAPGYSEHHSGRALDITSPGFEALEDIFEDSPAFKWLEKSALQFDFYLSYPRNNPHMVAYEPWHWCWHKPL